MGLILAAIIGVTLAVVGQSENEEAKKINDATRAKYCEFQERGEQADALVNTRSKTVNNSLAKIGKLKRDFTEQSLLRFLKTFDEIYKNKKLIVEEEEYDEATTILNKELNYKNLLKRLETIDGALSPRINGKKGVAIAALGAVGISTISAAIGGKALLPPILGSSFLGALPIAATGAYALSGFLNKKKAIEEQQKLLAQEEELNAYITKAVGFAESLTNLQSYLVESHNMLADIMDNFDEALNNFETFTRNYLLKTGEKKVDIKKLTKEERNNIVVIRNLSRVVYRAMDLPTYTLKGVGLIDRNSEEQMKKEHEESFALLEDLTNGQKA